jgi:hypothetical protein
MRSSEVRVNASSSPLRHWKYTETSNAWVLQEQYRDFDRLRVFRFLEVSLSFFGIVCVACIVGLFIFGLTQTDFVRPVFVWLLLLGFLAVCMYFLRICLLFFQESLHKPLVRTIQCNFKMRQLHLEGFKRFWSNHSTILKTISAQEVVGITIQRSFGGMFSLRLELLLGKRVYLSEVLLKDEATFIKELLERDL